MTDGQFRLPGRMDVALTGDVNNWAPTGIGTSTSIYIDPDNNWSITGIDAAAYSTGGNALERVLVLHNEDTTFTVSLVGLSGSSLAANQFAWTGTISLGRGESVVVKYDRSALLWRLVALGKVSSGGTTLPVDDATAVVKGSSDATKRGRFEVDTNVPTATTVALAFPASNGTIAVVAGSDTQVQFNDGGASGGDSALTWDKTNDQLTATHARVAGVLNLTGDVAVTVSTSPQNDWSPTGLATAGVLRVNPDTADVTITGIAAPSSPFNDGRILIVYNVGTGGFALIFSDESGSSTAANRLALSGQFHLRNDESAAFYYDSTTTRWRHLCNSSKTLMGARIVTDGSLQGFYDQNGNEVVQVAGVSSAVNHWAFSNATTGNSPTFQPGTGGDSNINGLVIGRGTGYPHIGQSGKAVGIAGIDTANPSATSEGAIHYRSDLEEWFFYDSSRSKWLSLSKDPWPFGHSSTGLAASTGLRVIGLATSDGTDANYKVPYDCTIVAWSYSRADSDSSVFEIMANTSTVKVTINTSATTATSLTENTDLSSGDELWVRVGSGAANAMDPRTFMVWTRRRAT